MRSTDLAITFFTSLTLVANLATTGIAVLAVGARAPAGWAMPAHRLWPALRTELAGGGLDIAWLVAAVATGGSLWFSEVAGFEPCRLCWVQRACMYPLVVVLAVAAVAQRRTAVVATVARRVGAALAGLGAAVATYHVLLERFPSLETGACDPRVPCTLVWFERLGFITLPYMALSAFVLIIALLSASRPELQETPR